MVNSSTNNTDWSKNTGLTPNDLGELFEDLYNKNISVIRDNKIDLILND
jgi:hypothetical protein